MALKPGSARAKGSRLERDAARLLGGKRMPLSGAVGGGDIAVPDGQLWSGWMFEAKAHKSGLGLVGRALAQAQAAIPLGSLKKPAALIREDRGRIVFACYLEDVVRFAEALAEVGEGHKIKSLLRQARRNIEEVERHV